MNDTNTPNDTAFANGATPVVGEALGASASESWTVVVIFTIADPTVLTLIGSDCNIDDDDGINTGSYNFVEGSASDDDLTDNDMNF